jgi:hypothetical protein
MDKPLQHMTWKQRSTMLTSTISTATYVNKQQEPFPTFMAYTLNMDVIIWMFTQRADITNMWILSK